MILYFTFFCTGFDVLFSLVALHCITELSVCCRHTPSLADSNDEGSTKLRIKELVEKHRKLISLIETANSIFGIGISCQILSGLGFFVVLSFQLRYGFDFIVTLSFLVTVVQSFLYCFISDYTYTMVRILITVVYSYNINFSIPVRKAEVRALQLKMVRARQHLDTQGNSLRADGDGATARIQNVWCLADEPWNFRRHGQSSLRLSDVSHEHFVNH